MPTESGRYTLHAMDRATRTDDGFTALMMASYRGHLGKAQLLVERGANVNAARTTDGYTALTFARQNGHQEIVQLLNSVGKSWRLLILIFGTVLKNAPL